MKSEYKLLSIVIIFVVIFLLSATILSMYYRHKDYSKPIDTYISGMHYKTINDVKIINITLDSLEKINKLNKFRNDSIFYNKKLR